MATDTPQLLLLTSTRNRCRAHRCNHSNERPLVSPYPDRRRQTRSDSQRNCHCTDHSAGTENVPLHLHLAVRTLLSPTILSELNPSLHCQQCFCAVHDIGEVIASHRIAHIKDVCTLHGHTLYCAPRDRTTLALRTERSRVVVVVVVVTDCGD